MSRTRYLTIHGHFYQPPRENAWLEEIERQLSARPYHDWNERIEAECYGPNAAARILNEQRQIVEITNNYARLSFNFGPTLLSWMEQRAPHTYRRILAADRASSQRFGNGSAMAQGYSHAIFPLLSERDKLTQVRWGVADFRHRFGRDPEGMWLPETAVDTASLEALATEGIKFTILAPRQAKAIRTKGSGERVAIDEVKLDTHVPYRVNLPSGRTIAIFFYDGPTSQAIAFEQLLSDGHEFAERLCSRFDARTTAQLVSVATDGETYGHHHRFGEMALAWAISHLEEKDDVVLTNYASFLAKHPPQHEVVIHESTAWSCMHGVGRWQSNCGCRMRQSSDQSWRGPLREALDAVRDRMADWFEHCLTPFADNPWAIRDAYIQLILDRRSEARTRFFEQHRVRSRKAVDQLRILTALEMQRNAMLMYTSCGWFFDDVHGIETRQILEYAVRAIELCVASGGPDLLADFRTSLEAARAHGHAVSAQAVLDEQVLGARFDHLRYAKQVAVLTLLRPSDATSCPAYRVHLKTTTRERDGSTTMASGTFALEDSRTGEVIDFGFGCAREGLAHFCGGVTPLPTDADGSQVPPLRGDSFDDLQTMVRSYYPNTIDSMSVLSGATRERVALVLVEDHMDEIGTLYKRLHEVASPLLRQLSLLGVDPPRPLRVASKLVLEISITDALAAQEPDLDLVGLLLEEARAENIVLREAELEKALLRVMDDLCERIDTVPEAAAVERLGRVVDIFKQISKQPPLRRAIDAVFHLISANPTSVPPSSLAGICRGLGIAWPPES